MEALKIYNSRSIEKLITKRHCETKFGEEVTFVESLEALATAKAEYVLLGVPEDIGIRANYGKSGAASAWHTALKSLLNIQINPYNKGSNLVLLGELDCSQHMQKAENIDPEDPNYHAKLGDLVKEIDQQLAEIIEKITALGKIPIIIGGGHNNAYPNIKGASKGLKKPMNVLNIDAHTDLRLLEHRHSGNGFSYAIEGGYLRRYTIFGLHKNYTPQYIFEEMQSENIQFRLFEELMTASNNLNNEFQKSLDFVSNSNFGLELDCDAIANFPASAQTPSGFTMEQVRNFIGIVKKSKNCSYLHICEAAPSKINESQVGKALSYFITDYISDK